MKTKQGTPEEIFEIRCRDRAGELYSIVNEILAVPGINLPDDLRFEAGRLLARIERMPGGTTLTVHETK